MCILTFLPCFMLLAADAAPLGKQQTLSIIKPNVVAAHQIGAIINKLEKSGLDITAIKMIKLSQEEAEKFYAEHQNKPFFRDLVTFMTSGPVVVMVLEGDNAIQRYREVMGATDPKKAAPGTIRAEFAASMTENAVHGSDAPESAQREIAFFFKPSEIFSKTN